MTDFLSVWGGCPLGWETRIFDIGMLKNRKVAWLSFAVLSSFVVNLDIWFVLHKS